MTDRVPGAPGQYQAVLSAEALAKMQAGEQFTITLTRDDQPITEGTPYSKAAVLPDALAQILCPDIEDPTPADALAALLPRNGSNAMTGSLDMGSNQIKNAHNILTTYLNNARFRTLGNRDSIAHDQTLERNGYGVYLFVARTAKNNGTGGSGCAYFVTTEQNTTTITSKRIWGDVDTLSFKSTASNNLVVTLSPYTACFAISIDSANAVDTWDT